MEKGGSQSKQQNGIGTGQHPCQNVIQIVDPGRSMGQQRVHRPKDGVDNLGEPVQPLPGQDRLILLDLYDKFMKPRA